MINRAVSGPRRRTEVSLSSPEVSSEPVEQLDQAVELLHRVTREMSARPLGPEELIALGGLLTQISAALLTFTDMLIAPVRHYDRIRTAGTEATTPQGPTANTLLRDCRNSYHAAGLAARSLHADLKRPGSRPCPRPTALSSPTPFPAAPYSTAPYSAPPYP